MRPAMEVRQAAAQAKNISCCGNRKQRHHSRTAEEQYRRKADKCLKCRQPEFSLLLLIPIISSSYPTAPLLSQHIGKYSTAVSLSLSPSLSLSYSAFLCSVTLTCHCGTSPPTFWFLKHSGGARAPDTLHWPGPSSLSSVRCRSVICSLLAEHKHACLICTSSLPRSRL